MNNVVGLNDLRHELWPNPQSMLISLLNLLVVFKQDNNNNNNNNNNFI